MAQQPDRVDELDEYLSAEQVAAMLHKSRHTIYRLIRQGYLPGTKLGNTWVLKRSAVVEAIEQGMGRRPARDGQS